MRWTVRRTLVVVVAVACWWGAQPARADGPQNTNGKLSGLKITETKCQSVRLEFARVKTFENKPIDRFQLYRDGRLVGDTTAANLSPGVTTVILYDHLFEPASGRLYKYQVAALLTTTTGEVVSPLSDPVAFRASRSLCMIRATGQMKKLVVVPALPKDISDISPDQVVEETRLKEMFDTNETSVLNFFKQNSIANGQEQWGGPALEFTKAYKLNLTSDDYKKKDKDPAVAIALDKELNLIRDEITFTNPKAYLKSQTVFAFVIMGVPAGSQGDFVTLGGPSFLPSNPPTMMGPVMHELGHRLGLYHAEKIRTANLSTAACTTSTALPFGTDPFSAARDCPGSGKADNADAMGSGTLAPFSAFSRHVLFGSLRIKVLQSDAKKSKAVRLYSITYKGPPPPDVVRAEGVWFVLDKLDPSGDSFYILEYRPAGTSVFTQAINTGCPEVPGIHVRFRPSRRVQPSGEPVQTYIAAVNCPDYSVAAKAKTRTYDSTTGLTVEVTDMTESFADVVLTWK